MRVDKSDYFFMLQLVKSQLLFLLLQNQLLSLQLILQILPLPLETPDLLITLFFDFRPLVLQLLDFILKLGNCLLAYLLMLRLFLFQLILNLSNLFFLDDVLFVEFTNLFFFIVDSLNLFFCLLSQLFELFFHSGYLVGGLAVLIVLESLLLGLSNLLKRFLFLLQGFELTLKMFQLIFLLDNLIDVILAIEVSPKLCDFSLVLLDLYLLIFEFLFQLDYSLILLDLICNLFLFLTLSLLLSYLIHLSRQLLQLSFQLQMLFNKLSLPAQTQTYAPFSDIDSYIVIENSMITIFAEKVEMLRKKPELLGSLTYSLLRSSAEVHHPHHKLIPGSQVQQLINIYSHTSLASTNSDTAHSLLAANCLVALLKVNFGQLTQNKLHGVVVMHYGQIIEHLLEQIRKDDQGNTLLLTKLVARGIILSKIILNLIGRSHAYLPGYYRFARTSIEKISELLKHQGINSYTLSAKQSKDNLILRMCFSKKITRQCLVNSLNSIQEQIRSLSSTCPSSKDTNIVNQLTMTLLKIRQSLPENESVLMWGISQEEEQKDSNIYIEEPLAVRELTPRIYDEEKAAILSKLRKKKLKLKKRIEVDLRRGVQVKQQQVQVLEDVRRERGQRRHKKQLFVIEKQTAEARKYHKKQQKVKRIKKSMTEGKNSKASTQKSRLEKLSRRKKK